MANECNIGVSRVASCVSSGVFLCLAVFVCLMVCLVCLCLAVFPVGYMLFCCLLGASVEFN